MVFFGEGNGKFHAADANNGDILFTFDPRKSKIPNVGGAASGPSIYVAKGREFVVNAFGGNVPDRNNFASFVDPDSGKGGDAIIAFALPARAHFASGNRSRNRLPRPTSLSTSISPPSSVTMLWQTESPRPVPTPTGLVVK